MFSYSKGGGISYMSAMQIRGKPDAPHYFVCKYLKLEVRPLIRRVRIEEGWMVYLNCKW